MFQDEKDLCILESNVVKDEYTLIIVSPFQLMMDEHHLTEDELEMIHRGETPATVETLGRLRDLKMGKMAKMVTGL